MKQTGLFNRFLALAVILALTLALAPAAAAENQHGYIVVPKTLRERTVNFRRQANTNDTTNYPIARLPENWVVEILGKETAAGAKWYHIMTDANTTGEGAVNYQSGYVMEGFVQVMSPAEEAVYAQNPTNVFGAQNGVVVSNPAAEEDANQAGAAQAYTGNVLDYVRVNKVDVSLRDSVNGVQLSVVPQGTVLPRYQVTAAGAQDAYEWSMVQYNGVMGFMRGDCYESVTAGQGKAAANAAAVNETIIPGQTQGVVLMDNVFFRKTMSTAGDFWSRLPLGWTMQVQAKETRGKITWYKVVGGIPENPTGKYTGYIHGDYFALVSQPGSGAAQNPASPSPTPAVVLTGDSNYGVITVSGTNMRQAPGGTSVSVLMAGAVVEIKSKPTTNTQYDWYYIRYNNLDGYVPATTLRVLYNSELSLYELPDNGAAIAAKPGATVPPAVAKGYIKLVKDKVNVRKTPAGTSLTATEKSKLPIGSVIAYLDGPTELISGYNWVLVTVNGIVGYIRSDCYEFCDASGKPLVSPAPTAPAPTAQPTAAPDGSLGHIKLIKGGVNFRRTPGGESLGQLPKDTVLSYFGLVQKDYTSLETWYEVYSPKFASYGYILSTMAELCDASGKPIVNPVNPTSPPSPTVGYVATKVSSVWLRTAPNANASTNGQVQAKGTVLPLTGAAVINGYEWYPVQTKDGRQGYLRGDCVFALADWQVAEYQKSGKVSTPTPGPATPRPGNSNYIITTIDKVYVRQTPSTKAATLALLSQGSVLRYNTTQVVGQGTAAQAIWYQVVYNGQNAWIHGNFVRVLSNAEYDAMYATASPKPGTTVTPPTLQNLSDVALTTAEKVRIRAGSSMTSKEIGMVERTGTELKYLGKYTVPTEKNNYYWFYIRYGNVTGWMRGDFVRVLTAEEKAARQGSGIVVPTVYRTLYKNATGDDVYALQYTLSQLGYLAADQVNGYYLASTENAVKSFQQWKGLTVDGIAGPSTQRALYSTSGSGTGGITPVSPDGSSTTVTLYPVEKSDWFKGDIQKLWKVGKTAILTDVYTGISFKAQRLYGDNHADCEPVDVSDTAAICRIFGVNQPQDIEDREQELQSYRRRPTWVTLDGRTFAGSVYGIPHNFSGDRIPNNGYNGQFCVHFTNSRTHTTNIVDPDASYNNYFGHQSAIEYAYTHSISGTK